MDETRYYEFAKWYYTDYLKAQGLHGRFAFWCDDSYRKVYSWKLGSRRGVRWNFYPGLMKICPKVFRIDPKRLRLRNKKGWCVVEI